MRRTQPDWNEHGFLVCSKMEFTKREGRLLAVLWCVFVWAVVITVCK